MPKLRFQFIRQNYISLIAFSILAYFLTWPAWSAEPLILQLECHPAKLVKDTIRSGEIMPIEIGINADGEMVVLFAVKSGGYWLGLVINNGETVCGLSAGPTWQVLGQQS